MGRTIRRDGGVAMKLLSYVRTFTASVFQRPKINAEMDEELRSHIAHRADDLERSGLVRTEAERRARIEFGGREKYKEEIHQALGSHIIETSVLDIRFSLR